MRRYIFLLFFVIYVTNLSAQLPKVSHAEPLYMDLVRDLGARKGEKELNIGLSMEDRQDFHTVGGLVEYEFAPANRLGVEVELPFEVHFKTNRDNKTELPQSSISGLKLATQYTCFVSEKYNLSLAVGYANDFEFHFNSQYRWVPENISHPFFVAAKSWKKNFHTLLYTGPSLEFNITEKKIHTEWMLNTDFHYMFPGSKNFIGVEINHKITAERNYSLVLRPQTRIAVSKQMMLGFVMSIPTRFDDEGLSMFCRLIYEFKSRKARFPNVSGIRP